VTSTVITNYGAAFLQHTRGKITESVIDSENLITLNNGKTTHFGTASGTQSAIDLTFTTPSFAPHLTWDTLSHAYGIPNQNS